MQVQDVQNIQTRNISDIDLGISFSKADANQQANFLNACAMRAERHWADYPRNKGQFDEIVRQLSPAAVKFMQLFASCLPKPLTGEQQREPEYLKFEQLQSEGKVIQWDSGNGCWIDCDAPGGTRTGYTIRGGNPKDLRVKPAASSANTPQKTN